MKIISYYVNLMILFLQKKNNNYASTKLLELCLNDKRVINHINIELEIKIFIEGLFCEYVKICHGYSDNSLDDLYNYTKFLVINFINYRSK